MLSSHHTVQLSDFNSSIFLQVGHVTAFVSVWVDCIFFSDPVAADWPDPVRVESVMAEQERSQSNAEWVIAASCVTRSSLTLRRMVNICSLHQILRRNHSCSLGSSRMLTSAIWYFNYCPFVLDYFNGISVAKNANHMHILIKRCARYLFRATVVLII